jgi:hypothetical protein
MTEIPIGTETNPQKTALQCLVPCTSIPACHILEHEDGGMMGRIRVVAPPAHGVPTDGSDEGILCAQFCIRSSRPDFNAARGSYVSRHKQRKMRSGGERHCG